MHEQHVGDEAKLRALGGRVVGFSSELERRTQQAGLVEAANALSNEFTEHLVPVGDVEDRPC